MSAQNSAPRTGRTTAGSARLLASYGELMDSRALTALFKFGSDRSFRRSACKGTLPVSVFRIPGRRGWFARTEDVAVWLADIGGTASSGSPSIQDS